MKFDSLKLQEKIEEKRLIFGIKFINFCKKYLLDFIKFSAKNFNNFLARKDSVFLSCFFIISTAAIILSTRDLGYHSALYIEIAQKILQGQNFDISNNSFLTILITTIWVFLAQIFAINEIIFTQISIFLIGIISIYSCAIILKNNQSYFELFSKNYAKKLLLISFCFAYFFRIYAMEFGEYATESGYFLALALPYICLHFKNNLTVKTRILSAILAILMILLKLNYAILVIIFEITKLYNLFGKEKNFWQKISPKQPKYRFESLLITIIFIAIYIFFFPQFAQNNFSFDTKNIVKILKENAYPLTFLLMFFYSQKKNEEIFRPLFLSIISAILIAISQTNSTDNFLIFAFAFPLILTQFYNHPLVIPHSLVIPAKAGIQNNEDRLSTFAETTKSTKQIISNLILILPILILPQFDSKTFFDLILNLCYFWWILLFFNKKSSFLLIFLAFLSIFISFSDKTGDFSWIFCALITLYLFYKTEKFDKNKLLNKKTLAIFSLIISYFLSLILNSIFVPKNSLKSPNEFNEIKTSIIKKYAPKQEDKVLFISNEISEIYPILNYAKKQNPLTTLSNTDLEEIKTQIKNKNLQVIFIKKQIFAKNKCQINILEYYLKDKEFSEEFLKNYEFLTQIHQEYERRIVKNIFANEQGNQIILDPKIIYNETEIYIRKK